MNDQLPSPPSLTPEEQEQRTQKLVKLAHEIQLTRYKRLVSIDRIIGNLEAERAQLLDELEGLDDV